MLTTFLLLVIYLTFIGLGLPDALLGAAWPAMYGDLAVEASAAGLISLLVSAGTILSSLIADRVVKRYGTVRVTTVSVALTALALLGNSFAPNLFFLCLMAIPMGLGAGSVDASLNNYVALHFKARHMSWLHCFWGVGAAASPLVMSFALQRLNSWRMGYRLVGLIQAAIVLILLATQFLWAKAGRTQAHLQVEEQKILSLAERFRIPGAKSAMLAFFTYCAIESLAGLWGSSYMVFYRAVGPIEAAQWISLYYLGITLGRFLAGFLSFKWSNRRMIWLGVGLMLAGVGLLFLPLGNFVLKIAFFLLGSGSAPIFPSLLQETPRNFGAAASQSMMGVQMASAYVGITLVPPFFGLVSQSIGYGFFPYFSAFLLLVMGLAIYSLNSAQKSPTKHHKKHR